MKRHSFCRKHWNQLNIVLGPTSIPSYTYIYIYIFPRASTARRDRNKCENCKLYTRYAIYSMAVGHSHTLVRLNLFEQYCLFVGV